MGTGPLNTCKTKNMVNEEMYMYCKGMISFDGDSHKEGLNVRTPLHEENLHNPLGCSATGLYKT